MEEHPIPQEVSTYEFRLVGDMTIKQFMQVAAGALISLVLYSSSLAPYVKWPLIVISFLAGVALAFFPIEDRPLSKWIVLFVKAIYSPTIYVWDKNARKLAFFQPEPTELPQQTVSGPQPAANQIPAKQETQVPVSAVKDSTMVEPEKLDKTEEEFLSKVNLQFVSPSTTPPVAQTPAQTPSRPGESEVVIPQGQTVKVESQQKEPLLVKPPEFKNQSAVGAQITRMASQNMGNVAAATFSQEASPPSPPTKPNVIVGQVLDSEGKIVDGAILEIKDSEGRSVRALRSNRLGHFMIVTPLVNGHYEITTEKEGLTFEPVSFEASDQIIPPIAIWAKQ